MLAPPIDHQPDDRKKAIATAVEALAEYLNVWGETECPGRKQWDVSVPPDLLLHVEIGIEVKLEEMWKSAAASGR